MNHPLPLVAIVGQPNAGKSTLMNKILGRRLTITSSVAGTTRDRQYADTSWNGLAFTLVDTAGLAEGGSELELSLQKQIDVALQEADLVLWVVDGKAPRQAVSRAAVQKFRKMKKPVLLAVNKLDSAKTREAALADFRSLGMKRSFAVSAISGLGIGDLLDETAAALAETKPKTPAAETDDGIAVALVGKPNVGKSSLFNAILKEDRVVVSPLPGTTRAAIDSRLAIGDTDYLFIDTAGLKKKSHRQEQPDVFAGFQTFKAIRRSDVCFLVIDATEEITKQDQRVASEIHQMQKGCVILANKIDAFKGNRDKLRDYLSLHFPFLWMCPVFEVSAQTGEGLAEALAALAPIYRRRRKEIDNQTLSEFLSQKLKRNPPRLLRDQKKPKVFSLRQIGDNPPAFELLVNHPAAISQQFRKFLENSIIKELDFWGTPITLKLKGKDKS
ncbi:MAG TPA: ribosome biogenesis GTPase Der [Patescibacteria group bacterium]|nr:ribosome biogenesis GTPase Der [Patescibacteria group bacterium]